MSQDGGRQQDHAGEAPAADAEKAHGADVAALHDDGAAALLCSGRFIHRPAPHHVRRSAIVVPLRPR
jgi:hypothetical protein